MDIQNKDWLALKQWVVKKAIIVNPYGKYWSASVTLGIDINGTGSTIEKAYIDLTDRIFISSSLFNRYNAQNQQTK